MDALQGAARSIPPGGLVLLAPFTPLQETVGWTGGDEEAYLPEVFRLKQGFAYLVAVTDWFCRYVLVWELSVSLESAFCVRAVQAALEVGRLGIFNTDQSCQYTSVNFTQVLEEAQVRLSMDGKGRAFDNLTIERLWRTVKYEGVFLKDYEPLFAARDSLG